MRALIEDAWSDGQSFSIMKFVAPLLDVTNSLRIAKSFASQNRGDEAFVYALGRPNLSGAITASIDGPADSPTFNVSHR